MPEGLNTNKEVKIKPVGSYFEVDKDGYLVNPASIDNIPKEWKPAVDDVIQIYRKQFGNKLKNVYIRGSVATGQAIKDVSDLDTFAYVDLEKEEIEKGWTKNINSELQNKYPFITYIEFNARSISNYKNESFKLNKAVSVYGNSLEATKMKPGKAMMRHIQKLSAKTELLEKQLEQSTPTELKNYCDFYMKEILRSGFDITMERSKRYTRDLYLCYKDFSEYYPEKESQMREVLYYALNPTSDKTKIIQIKDSIVPWLLEESKKHI